MAIEEKEKVISFLNDLSDAIGSSEAEGIEDVIADLEEEGIDVNASISRLREKIKQISLESKRKQLDIARERRLVLESTQQKKTCLFADWTKEKIVEKIRELTASPDSIASVSYRDIENRSKEDLAALLEDLIATREMEKKENH